MSESDARSPEQENEQDHYNDEYLDKVEEMLESVQKVGNNFKAQIQDLGEKITTFMQFHQMNTPEEVSLALKEPLQSMFHLLTSEKDWFAKPENHLPAVQLATNRPMTDDEYDWSAVGNMDIQDNQTFPLGVVEDMLAHRLNNMKTIFNKTSSGVKDMNIFAERLLRNLDALEWSLERNSSYAFQMDEMIKKLVAEIRKQLEEQCNFLVWAHPVTTEMFRGQTSNDDEERVDVPEKKKRGLRGSAVVDVVPEAVQEVVVVTTPTTPQETQGLVPQKSVALVDVNQPQPKRRKVEKIKEIITDEMGRYILDPAEIGRLTNCMQARFLHLVHFLKETTDWKVREEGMSRVLVACNDYTASEEDIKDSSWMNFMSERKLVAERMDGYKHVIALYGALENLKESSHASDVQKVVLFVKSQVVEGIDTKEPVDAEAGYSIDLSIWFRSVLLKRISVYWKENRDPMPYKYTGNLDSLPFVKSRIKLYEEKASTDVKSAAMFLMYELMGESDQLESLLAFYKDLESDLATAETKEQEFFESVFGIDLEIFIASSTV